MIFQISAYFKHFFKAKNLSKITDVKLRTLLEDILDEEKRYYAFLTLSMLRKKMSKDKRQIDILDLGAGSKKLNNSKRVVGEIAKLSVKKAKYAEVLFRLIDNLNIEKTIEVGTSLGVTTSYLSMANKKGNVITLEGCPETLNIAKENFKELGLKNIKCVAGNFDDTLSQVLGEHPTAGLVFIDGNHTKEATLKYFELILQMEVGNLVCIFDDIHWSPGMEEAWNEIVRNPKVQVSIDVYEMGIIFFNEEFEKCNYSLIM